MALKLVKASLDYKNEIVDMLEEWTCYNNEHETNTSPTAIFKNSYADFEYYIAHLETKKDNDLGYVEDSVWFCLDEKRHIMVGAINIRHYLNDYLLNYGGHIGDGIRPSERKKGYATKMITLALEKCRELGMTRVLMICDQDNFGSKKSIVNNGGILENEVMYDGKLIQRYWINLK